MLSGFDRYIQLARCFRDEDLRADRQPEFTQIDMELSFVDVDEILEINEGFFKKLFKEVLNIDLEEHFQRMTYKEAMESYGSDKPDIRFDMKIQDISDLVKDCGFSVFTSAIENGGSVRAIVAKNASSVYTRKEIDKLTEYAKGIGAKGLAYVRWVDEPNASFKKFMSEEELSAIYERLGAERAMLFSSLPIRTARFFQHSAHSVLLLQSVLILSPMYSSSSGLLTSRSLNMMRKAANGLQCITRLQCLRRNACSTLTQIRQRLSQRLMTSHSTVLSFQAVQCVSQTMNSSRRCSRL